MEWVQGPPVPLPAPLPVPAEEAESLPGVERSPPGNVPAVSLDVEKRLAPGEAVLWVDDHDADRFEISGYAHATGDVENLKPVRRRPPSISLAAIARKGGRPPAQVKTLIHLWSEEVAEVTAWLVDLVQTGVVSRVVIEDSSGHEIPWEMLKLPLDDEPRARYLGVELPVSRTSCGAATARPAAAAEAQSRGAVLAYLSGELAKREQEVQSLARVRADSRPTLDDFVRCLRQGALEYSFVYMACHGTHSDSIFEVALGSAEPTGERVLLGTLYDQLEYVDLPRPIFINACHSARLVKDRMLKAEHFHGFPELFLRRGARGVIGTAGEVSDEFAAGFARTVLEQAVSDRDATLAELLRRCRASVVQRAQSDGNDLDLVTAFMYVYYGDPEAHVSIGDPT